jgi:hypothetical protein
MLQAQLGVEPTLLIPARIKDLQNL